MSKRAGRHSQQANDFLQPLAPTSVVATDVGTNRGYDNGAVSVAFSLPAESSPATSYTVTLSSGQTGSGSSSPIVVTGIATGASVTATVVASNAYGNSSASSASASVTVTTVPAAPVSPTASSPAGATYDTVSWTAPATGGKSITNYYYSSSDDKTGNTTSTSVNVTQEAGTAQTYTIYADNANGRSTGATTASVTTFTFVPFSVFNFFGVFNFTPFSVFNFFGVFSFTPFNVFNFFGVFAFFGVFNFFGVFGFFSVFAFTPFSVFGFR
jgi:hypothetical protein